jgi:hypothetical protein
MAYTARWHRHPDRLWPVLGGPKEPWWLGHFSCISLPMYVWCKVSHVFLMGLSRAGSFDLVNGETINENWRRVWRQVLGSE